MNKVKRCVGCLQVLFANCCKNPNCPINGAQE